MAQTGAQPRARRRPPMRTYTIRALRREAGEVDIDFVLHGETGPASRWAAHARPGERLVMSAPDGEYSGDPGATNGVRRRISAISC
ncbi:siderophore-interacting protein [Pseudomonas aeruginosa]